MLYIHIPYCHRKCSYCAFCSVVTSSGREKYIDALCRELKSRGDDAIAGKPLLSRKPIETIYFGGGTPSMLSVKEIEKIVETVFECFDLDVEEVTIEANPEDLTYDWLQGLASLSFFNRLSIGVQSFNDCDLRAINRRHSAKQSVEAIERAAAAGFENVSIDLMMGLPGQDVSAFGKNLQTVSDLLSLGCIKHLSCYELTVEPGTILERQIAMGRQRLADDDVLEEEYHMLQDWCGKNGFEQYEVSNFCLPGFRSRHNSRYWDRTPYIGVGAGAHSFDGHRRRWNSSDVDLYSNSEKAPFEEELLTDRDAFNEYVMVSLRRVEGIEKSKVAADYSAHLKEQIFPFVSNGLIVETPVAYCPTAEGLLHADGIAVALFV